MAPVGRKKRAAPEEEDESSLSDAGPSTQQRKRRASPASSTAEDPSNEGDSGIANGADNSQITYKFVRYVLACEHSRTTIRREDIRQKVFGAQKVSFKQAFDEAQAQLREVFGVQMTELPMREKTTLKERLAAGQKQENKVSTSSSNTYILTSVLPPAYKAVVKPAAIPDVETEAAYIGLYTMIVSLITLNGGKMATGKLDNYLQRMNADVNMPMDKTEAVLAKMIKQGYLVRVKENVGGDEITEWMVGPRGKLEVGDAGVEGLVMRAYGEDAPEDLQERIKKSLGFTKPQKEAVASQRKVLPVNPKPKGRPRRSAVDEDDDE